MKFKSVLKSPYFYFIMLLPLGLLLLAAAKFVPGFADFYYKTLYRYLGGFFGSITGILPFSLMEAGIASIVILAVIWIRKLVLKSEESKEAVLKYFKTVLMKILSIVCAVVFLFSAFCGTNYHRKGFAEEIGLEVKKSSVDELYELCSFLLEEAVASGENLLHNENGETVFESSPEKTGGQGTDIVDELKNMDIADIRALVDTCSEAELDFMMDGVKMNEALAAYSIQTPTGVGIAASFRKESDGGILTNNLLSRIIVKVSSAAESRLDGCPLATMSSSGAGTKGLVVILPVIEAANTIGVSGEKTV
ncbi:MAG: DUF3810 family protein, partial [Oscillospiraceae bacterium]|nr:DUF3810 family protein [Oscillospiraceae bacterium]